MEVNFDTRVKYLDREDIESFGFDTEDNGECFNKTDKFILYSLYPWEWDKGVKNSYKIFRDDEEIFFGVIRNKSELKRLLQQLEVPLSNK